MGVGACFDETYGSLTNMLSASNSLFNPTLFLNSQTSFITAITGACGNKQQAILQAISSSGAGPNTANLIKLYETIYGTLPGQSGQPAIMSVMGQSGLYQSWTDFTSGQTALLPANLMPVMATLPKGEQAAVALGTLTFAGLLGLASGAAQSTSALCQVDENAPCAGIEAIFDAVLGTFNNILKSITAGLQLMQDFVNKAAEYLAQALGFVQDMVDILSAGLLGLINGFVTALNHALAKLFGALGLNPCFAHVLKAIGTPTLLDAIPKPVGVSPLS